MTIRTVYLAGGINGLSDSEALLWRAQAKRLLPRQINALDPMDRDYRGIEDANVQEIVEDDLRDIRLCDAVIANCARPSWGTAMEIHWAHHNRRGRPVGTYYTEIGEGPFEDYAYRRTVAIVPDDVPVSPWLRYHTDAVVTTVAEAVAQVVAWSGGGDDSLPRESVRSESGGRNA